MNEQEIIEVVKWKMHSANHFEAELGNYVAHLYPFGSFYPAWEIFKDGLQIDVAYRHHPVTSSFNKELAGKARIEKILKDLNTQN